VNYYINSKKGIYNYLLDIVERRGSEKEGFNEVYTSIFWYEYNLVLGPIIEMVSPEII
jgi:hypothetical protein